MSDLFSVVLDITIVLAAVGGVVFVWILWLCLIAVLNPLWRDSDVDTRHYEADADWWRTPK